MSETAVNTQELGEKIVTVLKTIYDPEIPVDIYELGLIYDVFVNEDRDVKILMTLTSPNCPVAETLPVEVEEKVKSLDLVKDAEVEITFDPPWTQELMSEEAKLELFIGWPKKTVRISWLVLTLFGLGIFVYPILALIMPAAD